MQGTWIHVVFCNLWNYRYQILNSIHVLPHSIKICWNYKISGPCFYNYWPLPSWSCCFPVWPGSGRTGTPVWSHVSYHCSRLFSAGKDTNLNPHICNMMSKKKLVAISRCMNDSKMISMRKILWKWIQLSNFSCKIFFFQFQITFSFG